MCSSIKRGREKGRGIFLVIQKLKGNFLCANNIFLPKRWMAMKMEGKWNHFGPKLVCDITWHIKLLWELILDFKNQTHELLVWTQM
jgi:hypothetical protein